MPLSASLSTASPRSWFEADHRRLVEEVRAVRREFENFELELVDGQLQWEGEVFAPWPQEVAEGKDGQPFPLRLKLIYPSGFPVAPIKVLPLSPHLPTRLWGHEWHRWSDGSLCLGRPELWDITYSARDVLEKSAEWWFNFLSYLFDHVEEMPDVGRAVFAARNGDPAPEPAP